MTKSVLASVMEDVSNLKTPAYFKTYASDYGTKVVVFRATEAIEVWDLGDTETVKALYKRMQESGDEDAVEALLYKSKSTNEYDLSAPASWRTVGKYDKVMHSWFASQGIRGWRMPFSSGDEIMLTTSAGLVCLGKLKQ